MSTESPAKNPGISRPHDFTPMPDAALESSLAALFEDAAARHPGNTAVTANGLGITYRDLNHCANVAAHAILKRFGRGKEPVVVLLGHDIPAVAAILGVLKSGRPYLPLTGAFAGSLSPILENSRPPLVITDTKSMPMLEEAAASLRIEVLNVDELDVSIPAENPGLGILPEDPAYIMYTSGSTGEAKGVVLDHRHAVAATLAEVNDWFVSPSDRISMIFSISFSASRSSLMNSLLTGAACCMLDIKAQGVAAALHWLRSERISVYRSTIPVFRSILSSAEEGAVFPDLRIVGAGGQSVNRDDIGIFLAHTRPHCVFINGLSSTETGSLTRYIIGHNQPCPSDPIPVGYPWAGKEVLILDDQGRPVRAGERGEIVVKSRYLSSGYLNRPDLTAEKFRTDPGDPEIRWYSMGDEGFIDENGALVCLGRRDNMVKIRGHRIQPEAVDLELQKLDGIRDAVTVSYQPARGEKRLIAYLVSSHPERPSAGYIRSALSSRLPDYMVPSMFIWLEALPQTATGKINRRELPEPSNSRPEIQTVFIPPADDLEETIAAIWKELLELDRVGVEDGFFELGGDSLLALRMILEVEKAHARQVSPAFFQQPTIRNLAGLLRSDSIPAPEPAARPGAPWQRTSRLSRLGFILRRREAGRKLASAVSGGISQFLRDRSFLFEWILSRMMLILPFRFVQPLVFRLADRRSLLRTIYGRQYKLFGRLLESLGISTRSPAALFRSSFINNLFFKVFHAKSPFTVPRKAPELSSGPFKVYARERKRLIEDTPMDRLDEVFPVQGFHHLVDARRHRQGVILLSLHGTAANRIAYRNLARRLDLENIQVISHNVALQPLKHNQFKGLRNREIPAEPAAMAFAGEAYRGQKHLEDGNVVLFVSDFGAIGPGYLFKIPVGDRLYSIKAGFAELALNTGAAVIPSYGRFTDDGRLLMEFLPPLRPGPGTRAEQIRSLIDQYAGFLNAAIKNHPEMLTWGRIAKHFRQPPALTP